MNLWNHAIGILIAQPLLARFADLHHGQVSTGFLNAKNNYENRSTTAHWKRIAPINA
jgi:hypothetical protein